MTILFLWRNNVDFSSSQLKQPKFCWTTLVCIIMLLHSWTFNCFHYKIVDHSKVRHSIRLLLSKITSSMTNWAKKRCNHLRDQWRYGFSISPPPWTIVNVYRFANRPFCSFATSSFISFWIGKNATSFMGWNKIEKTQMVSLSNLNCWIA
jgi:hypothetical protein